MTCGDKFNKNCPTGGSRVDPEEVDGRPLCDHPGCGKRLQGDGTCVDGHRQRSADKRHIWTEEALSPVMRTRGGGVRVYAKEVDGVEGGLEVYLAQVRARLHELVGQEYEFQAPPGKVRRYRGFAAREEYADPVVISRADGAPFSAAERATLTEILDMEVAPDQTALRVPLEQLTLPCSVTALQRALAHPPALFASTLAAAEQVVMHSQQGGNGAVVACLRGTEIETFAVVATDEPAPNDVDMRRDVARYEASEDGDARATARHAFASIRELIRDAPETHREHCPRCGRFLSRERAHVCPSTAGQEKVQVGELLEQYPMDIASATQLGHPIVFTGPGWYSQDDEGVFRQGEFATFSRLRIDPPPTEEVPSAAPPLPPFLSGTLCLLQAPNDALTAAAARTAMRRLRGLPPADAAVATTLVLAAVPVEQAVPLARSLSALFSTYPEWYQHERQETVLRRQLYQELLAAGAGEYMDSTALADLAEGLLYSYTASQGQPPPARAVPGAGDAPRLARVRGPIERVAEELINHPPDAVRKLLWETEHELLAHPEKGAVDILAWRDATYWRVRVCMTPTGWQVTPTETTMEPTALASGEEQARARVQGLGKDQQKLCPTCGLLLNTDDPDEHYCGWRGEFPRGVALLMRGAEDAWYNQPPEQRGSPERLLHLAVQDVLEGYRDLAEAREAVADAEQRGDDFCHYTARGHAVTPAALRYAVELAQAYPEANPFGGAAPPAHGDA